MTDDDVTKLFEGYAEEARERWGETDAFKESARRTQHYTKADWDVIRGEADRIYERFAELMRAPTKGGLRAVIEAHRTHLDRWFYPCSPEMHARVAALYVGDPRFAANFDKIAPGLAQFIHAAMTDVGNRVPR